MITPYISVRGKVNSGINVKGKIGHATEKLYPELEDFHVIPSGETQIIKSKDKYGINEVTVEGISAAVDDDIQPENIRLGKNILGVDGIFEGIDTSDATVEYGLNLTDVDLNTNVGGISDVSSDGSLYALASEKKITVYKVENGNITSLFSQTFNVRYNFSSCRFANTYEELEDGKLLNVYAASCGHDIDAVHMGCIRIKIGNNGGITNYATFTSSNMKEGWESNITNIYPHPTYPNIVMLIIAGRKADRGTRERLIQVTDSGLTVAYSTSQPSAYSSYDNTHGQWGDDNNFYLQDTTLVLTYKTAVDIVDGVINSASISKLNGYGEGFKSFSENYCLISNSLYDISGTTLLTSFSDEYVQDVNLLFEANNELFILATRDFQVALYRIDIGNNYNLVRIRSFVIKEAIKPFNTSGSHVIFDKVRITCELGNSGKILIITNDITKYTPSISRTDTTFYNTDDAATTADNILEGAIAYVRSGQVCGTMPNNGELVFNSSEEEQIIPGGYTSGGKINPINITELAEYNSCLAISEEILFGTEAPYTKLNYISTYDEQYILTGIPLLNYDTWKIELDYLPLAVNYKYNGIWGVSSGETTWEAWIAASADSYARYNGIKPSAITMTTTRKVYIDEFTGTQINTYIDGVLARSYDVEPNKTIAVLKLLASSGSTSRARLYGAKLYGDGKLLADYIPVLDLSGVPCLYDKVSSRLIYSATGTFESGDVMS